MSDLIARNDHLVEKILSSCGTKTLLQCRVACRLWAEESTRILRRRGITIAFRSIEDVEEFIHVPRPTSKIFTNFLIDIPSLRHPFLNDERLEMPIQVIDLLDICNQDIQELKFWYTPITQQGAPTTDAEGEINAFEGDELEIDGQNLQSLNLRIEETVELPNLESLQLLSNYVHLAGVGPQAPNLVLPHRMPKYFSCLKLRNLRSLSVQHLYDTDCSSTIISILKGSKRNLEFLKIPVKPFVELVQDPSVLLTSLVELDLLGIFHGFSSATDETLSSVIRHCPNLKKLGIEFSFRTTPTKMQELWRILAKSLEELKCTIQDRNLLARQIVRTDFVFPEMLALKSLQMRWANPGLIYYIDRLPALKELMLDTVWTRKIPGNLFPNGQAFQDGMSAYGQLVSLKLTESINPGQVKVFARYFPNLKMLGCSFDSNEALRNVYANMRSLKWLIVERRSSVTESEGICGLEENDLKMSTENFFEHLKRPTNVPLNPHDKRMPSISDLKDLETLELCQLGGTWQSLIFGVLNLPSLKSLVIQSKAFKDVPFFSGGDGEVQVQLSSIQLIAKRLQSLRSLTLWIRHSSERPSIHEIRQIENAIPFLNEISILNHSLCGI